MPLRAFADVPEQLHVVFFLPRQAAARAAKRALADLEMRRVNAQTDLRLFRILIAFLAAPRAGAAPLDIEKHQQVFATRLARVVAEAKLRRRLPLFEQRDELAQRAANDFKIKVSQAGG